MWWKLALALIELARLIARNIERTRADGEAEARIFLKQMEKGDALIAKARAARAGANADGVRDPRSPDPHSRD